LIGKYKLPEGMISEDSNLADIKELVQLVHGKYSEDSEDSDNSSGPKNSVRFMAYHKGAALGEVAEKPLSEKMNLEKMIEKQERSQSELKKKWDQVKMEIANKASSHTIN